MGTLLPFLMFGILAAAMLSRPLVRWRLIPLPVALVLLGFISSEIWVALGRDTGLRWQLLHDLVFYILLPIIIFDSAININIPTVALNNSSPGSPDVVLVPVETNPMAYHFDTGRDPKGRPYFWSTNKPNPEPSGFETDTQALAQGKITVSTITYDLNSSDAMNVLSEAFDSRAR